MARVLRRRVCIAIVVIGCNSPLQVWNDQADPPPGTHYSPGLAQESSHVHMVEMFQYVGSIHGPKGTVPNGDALTCICIGDPFLGDRISKPDAFVVKKLEPLKDAKQRNSG